MARVPRHYSGGRLRIQRRLSKYQQTDVAKKFGLVDTAMISRWECGEAIPSLENAFMLAKLYKVQVDDLFYEIGLVCQKRLYPDEAKKLKREKP